MIDKSADDIAALVRRLLETEQQLRALIASSRSSEVPAQTPIANGDATHPAALACALLDEAGVIVHASSAWRHQFALGGLVGNAREARVGANFLSVCERAAAGPSTIAYRLAAGIRSVLDGNVTAFALDIPGSASSTTRIDVFGLGAERRERVAVTLIDDTEESGAKTVQGDEGRFRRTFEQAAVGIAHMAPDGAFVEVNDRFCEITGYSQAQLLALSIAILAEPDDLPVEVAARNAMLAGEAQTYSAEKCFRRSDGGAQWIHLNVTLVRDAHGAPDHFIVVIQRITERKLAELRLQRLNRLYSVLRRVSEAMVIATDRQQLYADVCRIAVEIGGLPLAVISELTRATGRILPVAKFGKDSGYTDGLEGSLHDERGDATAGTALRTGQYDICNDIFQDPRMQPWFERSRKGGFRACASFPLIVDGITVGVLVLLASEVDYFQADEIELMVAIADELSFALDALEKTAQRERAQAALQASEASLIEAQRIARLGNWEWDIERNQLRWSAEIYRLFGLPLGSFADALAPETFLTAVHPEDAERSRETLKRCFQTGDPFDMEYRLALPGGEARILHIQGQLFFGANGRAVRLAGTAQDITQRRLSEDRLRQSESLLRIAGQTAHIGGWTFDIATQRLTLSDEVCAIRELPPGTVIPIGTALGLFTPEWNEIVAAAFKRCTEDGTPYDLEVETITAKGRLLWVRTMGQPVRSATGAIIGLQGAFQDISDRKRADLFRQHLLDRLTKTLESITDAFFTLDTEWRFTYVNGESERLMQLTRAEVLGRTLWEMFPAAVGSTFETEYRRAVADNCTVEFVEFYAPLNFWAEVRAFPSEEGLAVYFRDVTARKKVEQEAEQAQQTRAAILQVQQQIGASNLDSQTVMTLIAERAAVVTGASGGVVELVDGDDFVLSAVVGVLADSPGLRLLRENSLSGMAVATGEVLFCDDTEIDPRVNRNFSRRVGARSMIAAPLRTSESVIGVLKVISDRPHAFSPGDVSSMQILAESLSAVIDRHRAAEGLRASEEQYRLLFNSNPHPMWVFDVTTQHFLAVNNAAQKQYGYSVEEFREMTIHQLRSPGAVAELKKSLSLGTEGKRYLGVWQHQRKDGSLLEVEITSDRIVFNGQTARLVLAHDVTERTRAERELARVSRAQRLLSRCIEAQMHAVEESALLTEICQIAVDTGGYRMAWVGYARKDALRTITPMAHAGEEHGYLSAITLSWSEDQPSGQGPAGQTIRSGRPTVASDISEESAHFIWREQARQRGYFGVICLPLRNGEDVFGLLSLYTGELQSIGEEEIQLLGELADELAFGIDNLRSQRERRLLQSAVLKVAAGVSASTGTAFFEQLVRNMIEAVDADAGYAVRLDPTQPGLARSIMSVDSGKVVENFEYQIAGTPCADLFAVGQCVVSQNVAKLYPGDPMLREMSVQSYVGRRLDNSQGQPIGLLYVLYRSPLERSAFVASTLQIFAARAAAELERLDADARIREQASLLDKAQDAIVLHAVDGHRILYWNEGAHRLFGWSAEQALEQPLDRLLRIRPDEAGAPFLRVLEQGEWSGEFNLQRMDAGAVLVEARCTLVHDTESAPRAILTIMSDISVRRQAEDKLQVALVDLGNRNRELQDFAFVASHDLQEPLRKIRMFSDRLISRLSAGLDPLARDYLQRSAQAAMRMQTLIDDLLEYSRVDSRGKPFVAVDLGALMATVIEDLEQRIESAAAEVQIGPMPTLEGDLTQLRQLFQNLLANALKFRHADRVPRITVRAEPALTEGGRAAFRITVEDNGIGFDSKYSERIFVPFQRLHSREDYEGTGIGLAIVRRIVDRHHGSIEVTAVSGEGATFSIVLPQRQRQLERDRDLDRS